MISTQNIYSIGVKRLVPVAKGAFCSRKAFFAAMLYLLTNTAANAIIFMLIIKYNWLAKSQMANWGAVSAG